MREINKGDRVKFLNETGSGIVVAAINKDMVLVRTDDDGFEYPVLRKELLLTSESKEEVEELEVVEVLEVVEEVEKVIQVEELERPEKNEKKIKGKAKSSIEEVDLHISEILDDTTGMTSGEIVEVQLARFRTALEGAIRAKQKKIIFIHGKGAGKLKREIQKLIDNEYDRCRCQDASFREYGYGATLILIGQ